MRTGRPLRLAALGAVLGLVTVSALAATNAVPATRAGNPTAAIGVNDLKPAACAGLTLTAIVVGTNGTDASELVLGSAAGETLRGGKGDDCVLGGGGNDTLRGEQGTDVCIGGPGTDSFNTCETQIQ
jgi:Ca2+-binding RTX toxin-like protein